MFGCNGNYNFPEIVFMLTRIYPFDPEMNLRTHFHFNSFPGHSPRTATQREWEKRNTKVTKNTERTHPLILNQPPRASIQPPRRPTQPPRCPIQPPRRPTQPPRPPIQPLRAPSPKRDCLQREWINWTHCSDHRAKHFITVSFPSPVHRSDLCIIYIYIYIYIFIYFLFIY